jgi:hypothetical protein
LPEDDIRLEVLDLEENGLIERSKDIGPKSFWPKIGLFVVFDRYFLDFNNEQDAVAIANFLVSKEIKGIAIKELAFHFSDWLPRRLNSALNFLEDAKIVYASHALGEGPWTMMHLRVTDRTRRFVRDHG